MENEKTLPQGQRRKVKPKRPPREPDLSGPFVGDESMAALHAALSAALSGFHRLRPHSARDLVKNLYPKIQALQALGWRYEDIARLFQDSGVEVSARTLRNYILVFKTQADDSLAKNMAADYWNAWRSQDESSNFISELENKLKSTAARRRAATAASPVKQAASSVEVKGGRPESRPAPQAPAAATADADGASDFVPPRRSVLSSTAPPGAGTPKPGGPAGGSLRSPPPAPPVPKKAEEPPRPPAVAGEVSVEIPPELAPGTFVLDPSARLPRDRPFVWLLAEVAKSPYQTGHTIPDGRAGREGETLPVDVPRPGDLLSGKITDWDGLFASYKK